MPHLGEKEKEVGGLHTLLPKYFFEFAETIEIIYRMLRGITRLTMINWLNHHTAAPRKLQKKKVVSFDSKTG